MLGGPKRHAREHGLHGGHGIHGIGLQPKSATMRDDCGWVSKDVLVGMESAAEKGEPVGMRSAALRAQ